MPHYWNHPTANVSDFIGKVFNNIVINDTKDEVRFHADSGEIYLMYHAQDCCENVGIEEVVGDVTDLLGTPITLADESSNSEEPKPSEYADSFTWTFYNFATVKGYVTFRWLGESNGYYSESVDVCRLDIEERYN